MVSDNVGADDWRSPKSSRVVDNVNAARKFRKFTDVTFVVGSDDDVCTIKAHRVVLGTANAKLAKLLSESNKSEWIRIPDVSPRGFKNLIRYYYDADVKFTDLLNIRETCLVAEKFQASKLKLAAENCLNQAVNYESILEMLEISIEYDMPELKWKCIGIISSKYQDILKSEELIVAPFEVVETVLSNPCHGEGCQYYALETISKWRKEHETDQKQLQKLLKCVDITQVSIDFYNVFVRENDGILSEGDSKALGKYILSKDVHDAPEWYRFEKLPNERDYKTNAEALKENISEMKFSEFMEKQKLKVQVALDKELCDVDKFIMEAADKSIKSYEKDLKDTAKLIIDYFSVMIKEAVETSVECIEDDRNCIENMKKENIKFADGEKESDPTMEVASASDIATHLKTEYDSIKGSGIVLKCADSVKACGTVDMNQGATSLLAECR